MGQGGSDGWGTAVKGHRLFREDRLGSGGVGLPFIREDSWNALSSALGWATPGRVPGPWREEGPERDG